MTLVSCTSPSENSHHHELPHSPYQGDLEEKLNTIYSKENEFSFEACDVNNRTRILEVAKALEIKRKDIESFIKHQPPAKDNEVGKDLWSYDSYSWNEAISLYEQIKDQPVNHQWAYLNRLARAIVLDDSGRIVNAYFTQHHRDAGPIFIDIRDKIKDCVTQEQCTNPILSLSQREFLQTNWLFKFYLEELENAQVDFSKKKDYYLPRFLKRIEIETQSYEFHNNQTIRSEGQSLLVPMDLSVIQEGAPLLTELIEKSWNIDTSIKIKVVPTHSSAPHYLLKVDETIGGRAFVFHNNGQDSGYMQLFNLSKLKTIIHEFGHVIGLTDEYYTKWNPQTCEYTNEFNEGNIMSDSTSGKVLQKHWESIKKNYWK
jgi:hypothetical protein